MRALIVAALLVACGGTPLEQTSTGAGGVAPVTVAGAPLEVVPAPVAGSAGAAPVELGGAGGTPSTVAGAPSVAGGGSTSSGGVGGSSPVDVGGSPSAGSGGSAGGVAGSAGSAGSPAAGSDAGGEGGAPACTMAPALDLCVECPITLELCPDADPVWHAGPNTYQCAPDAKGGCTYAYTQARAWQKTCCAG